VVDGFYPDGFSDHEGEVAGDISRWECEKIQEGFLFDTHTSPGS